MSPVKQRKRVLGFFAEIFHALSLEGFFDSGILHLKDCVLIYLVEKDVHLFLTVISIGGLGS